MSKRRAVVLARTAPDGLGTMAFRLDLEVLPGIGKYVRCRPAQYSEDDHKDARTK
jgi:hypothetical protein